MKKKVPSPPRLTFGFRSIPRRLLHGIIVVGMILAAFTLWSEPEESQFDWEKQYYPRILDALNQGLVRYTIDYETIQRQNVQTKQLEPHKVVRSVTIYMENDPYPYLIFGRYPKTISQVIQGETYNVSAIYYTFNYPNPSASNGKKDQDPTDSFSGFWIPNLSEAYVYDLVAYMVQFNPNTGRFEGQEPLAFYGRPIYRQMAEEKSLKKRPPKYLDRLAKEDPTSYAFQIEGLEREADKEAALAKYESWNPSSISLKGAVGDHFYMIYQAVNGGAFLDTYYFLATNANDHLLTIQPTYWLTGEGIIQWAVYRAKHLAKYFNDHPENKPETTALPKKDKGSANSVMIQLKHGFE